MKLDKFGLAKDDLQVDELCKQIRNFNDNRTDYPRNETVHALFSARAADWLDAPAILHEDRRYSYGELEKISNQFARFLINQDVQPQEPVAVILERAFEMVAAILGILKAGGAYVPIDYDAPSERKKYLLNDLGVRLLVTEKSFLRELQKLQWECFQLTTLFCVDSHNIYAESEGVGEMMKEPLWDHVGRTMFDDISGGGWTSSYTGEWLSREVMDQYGENILNKLEPYLNERTRMLEIGCASGISMFRLAPRTAFYCGTDLSGEILRWTDEQIRQRRLNNIQLRHLPAHDVNQIDEREFDVVVMNSVVQCFSGYNYLRDVLRKAIDLMTDRGVIFLGNLWDEDKKEEFVRSLVEFQNANVGQGYRTKADRSEELFISRAFLDDLRHEVPEIAGIESSCMLGTARSELSDYGYDVILHIDKKVTSRHPLLPRKKYQFDLRALDAYSESALEERTTAKGLAYIIYTSGTSGQPKGVMVEHRAIARLVLNTNYLQLGKADRCLQTGSLTFDASTFEIWGPLLNGGALCRPSLQAILHSAEMSRLIAKHKITVMWLTSSLFNQHVDNDINTFNGLKYLLVGGEKLSTDHINRVRKKYPDLVMINCYGPTENTTFTTCHLIERTYASDIPIGRPISNTEVLILDRDNEITPIGIPGEICAGGDGLARGYFNDDELTEEKFIPHPFNAAARLYRTGDLGLWRADGTVECLGRIDDQVKIRGYRVEPSEIETHLLKIGEVREALVLAKDFGGSSRELVAYVTGQGEFEVDELRKHLKRTLPDYMVPPYFVRLPRLPLNVNGKVERKSLPDPHDVPVKSSKTYEPPKTETERQLVSIWEQVLGHVGIGVTDNFFDSGGHSLKVAKLISLIEKEMDVVLPLTAAFKAATIKQLASLILDKATFGLEIIDEAMACLSGPTSGPNLFAFPPGVGDAAGFIQLAQQLKPYCFYGFNFIEAESRITDYANLVERVDPDGPYLFFGYSSGGNLAYHVTREIEARGRRVCDILMIDSARKFEKFQYKEEEVRKVANDFLNHESNRPYLTSTLLIEKAYRMIERSYDYVYNSVDYHVVDANIHVLGSEHSLDIAYDESGKLLASRPAWAAVTRGTFKTYQGYGNHNQMLYQPDLNYNIGIIRDILDQACKKNDDRLERARFNT